MKTLISSLLIILAGLCASFASKLSSRVVERGRYYKVVESSRQFTNSAGEAMIKTNRYTVLQGGLNRKDSLGTWVESKPVVQRYGDAIVCTGTTFRVIINANLNTDAAVDFESDGKRIVSHPLSIGFYDPDSGDSIQLARVKDCQPTISSNRVIFPDAFEGSGITAAVTYSYDVGRFAQEVTFRTRPSVTPADFNMGSRTRLEVISEILQSPTPTKAAQILKGETNQLKRAWMAEPDLVNEKILFSDLVMPLGRAFQTPATTRGPNSGIPVAKRLINAGGRTLLIEAVEFADAQSALQKLFTSSDVGGTNQQIRLDRELPQRHTAEMELPPFETRLAAITRLIPNNNGLAALDVPKGFLMDYEIVEYMEEYIFRTDTTYLVSSASFDFVTIEGGAVIKFPYDSVLSLDGVDCQTTPDRPAVLTAVDDNSVGETIDGSSGEPSGYYGSYNTLTLFGTYGTPCLHDVRFSYLQVAIDLADTRANLTNIQILKCATGIADKGAMIENGLFSNIEEVTSGESLEGAHLTIHNAQNDGWSSMKATNSLFVNVGSLSLLTGEHNVILSSDGGVFQSGPLGDHYLASASPYVDAGSTTADHLGLFCYTTQPGAMEGTSTVDLGYHYLALDANGDPISTLVNGVADYVSDSNGNGLVDSWEQSHFGNFSQSASDDYDSDGTSNLEEYQNGTDPNTINFSIFVTNNYVNSTQPTLHLEVTSGTPAKLALLVDSTNFGTATWNNYSPNPTLNLGFTQGWHEVRIGLRGRVSTSQQTWQWKRMKLDLAPPILVVINPTNSTISQPLIQLQGYCSEMLTSLRYDVSNATESTSNKIGLVTDQHYSTNTWEFTTNHFQCFDIGLTNGNNTITLRAWDRAGNVTTTNFTFTLNYSGDSNSPAIRLDWPKAGTRISSDSFTCRGWLDDATAGIVAFCVDSNGDTNIFDGLVERDGSFWIENLPLRDGTNFWTLTSKDVVGNARITNVIVVKTNLLTMNAVSAGDTSVSGSIAVSGYTVWVNGLKATNYTSNGQGGYDWDASPVPMAASPGGTLVVQARAIPNSENNGNGTGGGGSGSGGGGGSADNNPHTDGGADREANIEGPSGIYLDNYESHEHWDINGLPVPSPEQYDRDDFRLHWQNGAGGSGDEVTHWNGDPESEFHGQSSWPTNWWPQPVPDGVFHSWNGTNHSTIPIGRPYLPSEHFAGDYNYAYPEVLWVRTNVTVHVNRTADAKMKLKPGGKNIAGEESLWIITASATEILNPRAEFISQESSTTNIPPERISIGSLGNLDTNGMLAVVLPDGDPDVTPRVEGVDVYTYSITGSKHKFLSQCFSSIPTNRARTTIGVGEQVSLYFSPTLPMPAIWFASSGAGISPAYPYGAITATLTAPSNAANVTVTASLLGAAPKKKFDVKEPAGYADATVVSRDEYAINSAGAGVNFKVFIGPTNVSFYNVQIEEVSGPATGVTGYFSNWSSNALAHSTAGYFFPLANDNSWNDHCWSGVCSPPWSTGGYTWVIPARWKVGSLGRTNTMPGWTQVFSIDSAGTVTITKFGDHGVTRHTYEVYGVAH